MARYKQWRALRSDRKRSGYAYLGLLILLSILATVATATAMVGTLAQRRLAEQELLHQGMQIAEAIRRYHDTSPNGQARYPASLNALLRDERHTPYRRHLRRLVNDPMSPQNEFMIMLAPEGGIMGVYSRSTAKPLKQTGFEPMWQHLGGATTYQDWIFSYPRTEPAKMAR